jgi:hypothetical protein
MTNGIHGQTKTIGETFLAEAQALADAAYVDCPGSVTIGMVFVDKKTPPLPVGCIRRGRGVKVRRTGNL